MFKPAEHFLKPLQSGFVSRLEIESNPTLRVLPSKLSKNHRGHKGKREEATSSGRRSKIFRPAVIIANVDWFSAEFMTKHGRVSRMNC